MSIAGPLGRFIDIGTCITPVDSQTAAMTGKRTLLRDCGGVMFVIYKAAGTANDDPVITLQEHTASTGGTSTNLVEISDHWIKQEATLDNDETWTKVTQTAAATLTLNATSAESEMWVAFAINEDVLTDTYDYVSINIADTGAAGAQLISAFYIHYDLQVQRTPANLPALLR